MGSLLRSGDMASSSSGGFQQHNKQPESDLVKVHTSPVKPFHVPSINSIFQTVPKLYKYRPDQLEVIYHRRSGDVDQLPPPSNRKNPAQKGGEGGDTKDAQMNWKTRSMSSAEVSPAADRVMFEDEQSAKYLPLRNMAPVGVEQLQPTAVETALTTHEDRSPDTSKQPVQVAVPACHDCDSVTHLVSYDEGEIERLKMLVVTQDAQLMKLKKRNADLEIENLRLKKDLTQVNDAMYKLCVTAQNSYSVRNHDKIMQLIEQTNKSSAAKEDSFQRMAASFRELRESVKSLRSTKSPKPGAPSPPIQTRENGLAGASIQMNTSGSVGESITSAFRPVIGSESTSHELNEKITVSSGANGSKSGEVNDKSSVVDRKEKLPKTRKSSDDDIKETKALQKLRSSPLSALALYY